MTEPLNDRDRQLVLDYGVVTPANSSNTIEVLDALPRFFFRAHKRDEIQFVDRAKDLAANILTRVQIKGATWEMSLAPALIKSAEGNTRRFPGPREEFIDHTLRRLAAQHPECLFQFSGALALKTHLSMIRRDLAAHGHGFKLIEIHEGLQTMAGSTFEARNLDEELSSRRRRRRGDTMGLIRYIYDRDDSDDGDGQVIIVFHELFYQSLRDATYKQLNYDKYSSLSNGLARWIYQRISHEFTPDFPDKKPEDEQTPYSFSLTFIRTNAPVRQKTTRRLVDDIQEALDELKAFKILRTWTETVKCQPSGRGRPKIADVMFSCWLTEQTALEILEVLKRMKPMRDKARFGLR
jgi:hypothetical protein